MPNTQSVAARAQALAAGTYKLRHDVTNPKPDRRANQNRFANWRSWALWPAGTSFIVEPDPQFPQITRVYARGGFTMDAARSTEENSVDGYIGYSVYSLLVAALDPVPESPSDYLLRRRTSMAGGYALQVLDILCDRCGIPLEEIERTLEQIDAEEES